MADTNDPLAGVPAVESSELIQELLQMSNKDRVTPMTNAILGHIAWERQQRDLLRARVERLRAVVARASEQAVRFGGLSVVQFAAITSNALEPGDLEG